MVTAATLAFAFAAAVCLLAGASILVRYAFAARGARTAISRRIVASDTGVVPARTLREPSLGLRGRPDYLLEIDVAHRPVLVPMELKPSRRSGRVFNGDEEQLAAYLLALRAEEPARFGGFGYVRYATGTFRITLTAELERRIRQRVELIRRQRAEPVVHRSHEQPGRCRECPVRHACDERLR